MTSFFLDVSYSQISVFDGRLENPFNNWTDQHVRQGFSWRRGSVSFKTLIESGPTKVEVVEANDIVLSEDCVRAITVPFTCEADAHVEISTTTESKPIDLESGQFQLVFEMGISDEENWCRFTFLKDGTLEPEILIKDTEIDPTYPLIMEAMPA